MTTSASATEWSRFATAEARPLDESTRYLAAAAHLDRHYADDVVREFLVEPTRQIPPSTGLDTPTVLTEAVAARTRRKYRDGLLALLAVAFVLTSLSNGLIYVWVLWATVLSVRKIWSRARWNVPGGAYFVFAKLVLVFLLFAAAIVVPIIVGFGWGSSSSARSVCYDSSYYGYGPYCGSSASDSGSFLTSGTATLISVLSAALMLLILVVDRVVVWRTVNYHFGRRARVPGLVRPPAGNRPSLALSPPRFREQLDRHRRGRVPETPDAVCPVVVYRGRNPFIGAGMSISPWSLALPLEPDGKPKSDEPLSTDRIYREVCAAVAELQRDAGLAPDERLRELKVEGVVFVPAENLIDHENDQAAVPYLRNKAKAPSHYLPVEEANRIYRRPREWSRYYLSLQVETWDRELVMSAYLHAAVEGSTLYLEWTPCVLLPIRDEYKAVDKMTDNLLRPIGQGILRWLRLPLSGPGRFWHAVKMLRPLPHDAYTLNADRYGLAATLRELGAADSARDYFQIVDVERYTKLMESRLVPAISRLLRDCGYSPATFERRIATLTHNVTINGTNTGPMVFGGTVGGDVSGGDVKTTPAK